VQSDRGPFARTKRAEAQPERDDFIRLSYVLDSPLNKGQRPICIDVDFVKNGALAPIEWRSQGSAVSEKRSGFGAGCPLKLAFAKGLALSLAAKFDQPVHVDILVPLGRNLCAVRSDKRSALLFPLQTDRGSHVASLTHRISAAAI